MIYHHESYTRGFRDGINKDKYYIGIGTVQPYVARTKGKWFFHCFGIGEYRKEYPVLTESLKAQAEKIVDALNNGSMTEEEAKIALDKIWI